MDTWNSKEDREKAFVEAGGKAVLVFQTVFVVCLTALLLVQAVVGIGWLLVLNR